MTVGVTAGASGVELWSAYFTLSVIVVIAAVRGSHHAYPGEFVAAAADELLVLVLVVQ
jgi:hypothetical protein